MSRRNRPDDLGLPGGKVDPGETPEEAIVREVFEETGLTVRTLREVFRVDCVGEVTYDAITYLAECEGTPVAKEAGIEVRWITWDDLLRETNAFYEYNKSLFQHVQEA